MGSDREHGGSGAVKGRKRQLVLESSDSEADEYRVSTSTPEKPDEAAAGNADAVRDGDQSVEKVAPVSSEKLPGAKTTETDGSSEKNAGDELKKSSSASASGPLGCGDESREKVVPASADDKLSSAKSTDGDYAEKNKGDKVSRSSSQPDTKRSKIEAAHVGNGGSVSKDVTGGKKLRPGFPTWRFEKPEVRAGRVDAEMKATSGSKVKERVLSSNEKRHVEPLKHEKHKPLKTDKTNSVDSGRQERREDMKAKVKEQASSLDDKRRQVEASKHEKQVLLKTDKGGSVESGQREAIRVQGKSGLLKIMPKKAKVDGETSDSNTRPKDSKVVEAGDGRILTKSGVLKLLPKNNTMARENSDGKLLSKNIKLEREITDGKILTKTSKVDRETGDDQVPTKNIKLDGETSDGKIPARNNRVDGGTITGNRRDKDTSSAINESQKHDANGGKTVSSTKKLVSSVTLRRSDPSVVGVSSGHTTKQQSSKAPLKVSSQPSLKDDKTKLGEHKNEKKRLLEHKGSPENLSKKAKSKATDLQGTSHSALEKHTMKKPREGPRIALKQKLRDQIKGILLNNGWKIDLRPRRDKDYEDSVYVSPQGNGYWSITKAYAVYQEQLKSSQDEKPISKDDLAMLQRIVRKRRSQKEHSAEKKCGDNRSRKLKDTSSGRSSRNTYQNNEEKVKTKNRGCGLVIRGSTRNMQGMGDYIPYKWKRTVLSWMIDLGVVSEDAKVKYMNKKGTQAKLDGRITRNGINCGCCSKILTAAKFELHAGSKEQQPYANIFLEDGGVPLLQCLLDAWDKQAQCEKKGFYKIDPAEDPDDDTCGICGDGGDLLCCDHCTSTFHVACLGIEMPTEDWYCRSCICKFCGSAEEMTSSSAELLSCLQCSRKYHQVCAPGTERDSVCTTSGASIDRFCSPGCRKIYKRLKKLVGFKNDMEAGFSWSLVHCFADSEAAPLKKKAELAHCNAKTAVAFSVMDECFLPRIDERSGINIVHNVVYNCGSDFNRLNFSGFYTFILERGDEVISAATVRIHGTELAEMPFIGTRGMHRRKGMCHRLLDAIESTLCSLNVRRLVIPAIRELQNTWSTVFGFKPVGPMKKQKLKSFNLLIIHGTGLLEKRLLLTGQGNQPTTAGTVNAVECDKMSAQMFGEASGSLTPVHASRECAVGDNIGTKNNDTSLIESSSVLVSKLPLVPEEKPQERTYPVNTPVHASRECAVGDNIGTKDNDSSLIESSSILASKLPPVPEEKPQERTSPVNIADVNLRTSEDDMPCKAEADNKEGVKCAETDVTLVADNIVTVEKPEDISSSSYADSSAIPGTMDTGPCSSNELGKGENCPPNELSVDAVLLKDKTESNLNSNSISVRFDTQEDMKSCVVPLVTRDRKPDNHELKTIVADADTQSSLEVKGWEVIVNERSRDAYTTKDQTHVGGVTSTAVATTEEHSRSAVDLVVSTERSLDETKSVGGDKSEVKVATIEVGAIAETSSEAGRTVSALERSNDRYGEDTAKPILSCGEGQLHGEDGVYKNSLEDGLASGDPVNA